MKQDDSSVDNLSGTKEYVESLVTGVTPRWHSLAPDWAKLNDAELKSPPHLFWDVGPDVNKKNNTLNFVVEVPEGSPVKYSLDLTSGMHVTEGPYCSQPDSWKKYDFDIERPPFTIGIVPRVLDQLMLPQKIIVFGNGAYYREHFKTNFFDARVVGAYVEQVCPDNTCQHEDSWKSRLVLIGVQNRHPKFENVKRPEDLKKIVDWTKVEAFVENGQGKNKILKKYFPAFRMGALVDASQALHFLGQNSHVFTIDSMKDMKVNCYKLYDHIYQTLGHKSALEKPAETIEQIKLKSRVIKEQRLKKLGTEELFFSKFIKTFKKFHKQLKTCSNYVYVSNLQHDRDRHWFMTYIMAFTKMHDLGYVYDCSRKSWFPNPLIAPGKRAEPVEKQMGYCTASSIDRAFDTAVHGLNRQWGSNKTSYRYVTYDQGPLGTHNKIYSWVATDGKVFECKEYSDYRSQIKTFPSDIRWIPRDAQGKTKTELGDIIY